VNLSTQGAPTTNRVINSLIGVAVLSAVLGFGLLAIQNGGDRQVFAIILVTMLLGFLAFLVIYLVPRPAIGPKPKAKAGESPTVYDTLRNHGSRDLGPKLLALYNEYAPMWTDILNTRDDRRRQAMVNALYDNLKSIVWDHDGGVEHKECWRRLGKLRDNVHVWRDHVTTILPPDASNLINELLDLANDFPREAQASSRAAGEFVPSPPPPIPTPSHLCGQDLQRIHQTFYPRWQTAKRKKDMDGAYRMLDSMKPLIQDFITNHQRLVPPNARLERLVEFGKHFDGFIANDLADHEFWSGGDGLFAEMLDVAQAFQLAH
jgi:hypothetical protein